MIEALQPVEVPETPIVDEMADDIIIISDDDANFIGGIIIVWWYWWCNINENIIIENVRVCVCVWRQVTIDVVLWWY